MTNYKNTLDHAKQLDDDDPLKAFRDQFHFPQTEEGRDYLYFSGNSLGLQPKTTKQFINQELEDWAKFAVEGHSHARDPWIPYHENVTATLARLTNAKPTEVVAMNTLTVNLHLMMVSFYKPTKERFKILIEGNAFPSDQYAVASQVRFHGFDPNEAIIEVFPRPGENTIRHDDLMMMIDREADSLAMIMLGHINYLSGQAFNIPEIAKLAQKHNICLGLDLAHGIGNIPVDLHDWGIDWAAWCTYKYLNSGPGGIAGCFVHEKNFSKPHFNGWWGHDKVSRFEMGPDYQPIKGAEAWQLSNPPIFQLASLRASLKLFDQAGFDKIRAKSVLLTGFLEFLLKENCAKTVEIITPAEPGERGAQLSLKHKMNSRELKDALKKSGIICDARDQIIRVAPIPLYNNYQDVFELVQVLKKVQ